MSSKDSTIEFAQRVSNGMAAFGFADEGVQRQQWTHCGRNYRPLLPRAAKSCRHVLAPWWDRRVGVNYLLMS